MTSHRLVTICHEQDAADRPDWRPDPAADLDRTCRKRGPERRRVGVDTSTRRAIARQHQEPRGGGRPPSSGASDGVGESALPIDGGEHRLDVRHHDFTSIIKTAPVERWNARTSIEPRSPRMSKVTSAATSQASASSSAMVTSTRPAWRASSNRSRPSPRHRSRTSMRASSLAATRASVWTGTRSARPRSIRPMTDGETPARSPSWTCVQPLRIRKARIPSPNLMTSTGAASVAGLRWGLSRGRRAPAVALAPPNRGLMHASPNHGQLR